MDENPATIPTGFAPLDFLVTLVMPSISESIIETWDNVVFELAEKAKDKGVRGINDFILTNAGKDSRYGYNFLEINQIIFDKLLKGEIKKIDDLQNLQRENNNFSSSPSYILFYYKQKQKDTDEEATIIDCIFTNL